MGSKTGTEVSSYKFQQFSNSSNTVEQYTFGEFSKADILDEVEIRVHDKNIRKEREAASTSNFKILNEVQNLRGIRDQEKLDYEQRIQKDLSERLEKIKKASSEEGFNEGFEAGKKQAYDEAIIKANEQIEMMNEIIHTLQEQKIEMLTSYKLKIFNLVRQLTKWFTLKEVSEDHSYLSRLIEKLIHEINTKSNLIIKVNKSDFDKMPEALLKVEERLGKLQNVRIEIDLDMSHRGIIIESENGLIDGSFHAQFQSFDKVFESVGLNGDD